MGFSAMTLFMVLMTMFSAFARAALADGSAQTRRYNFEIKMQKVKRLCEEKSIVTVNDQFPGPQITAREGDRLIITVVNHVPYNVTLHWHGVKQLGSGWADGTAYITQCPIQTGQSYTHNFTISGQTGTLFWHAHISWLRVTLYGPIIILPKRGVPYPFPKPYKEVPIMLGEWWKQDTEILIGRILQTGGGIDEPSDAYTINGLPGPSYNCSHKDTFKLKVKPGKTYLLRLINAALNTDFFFGIANHKLTVVEVDAVYVKPFKTNTIFIGPGQTTNLLLKTKSHYPKANFAMAAKPHPFGPVKFSPTISNGILEYEIPSSKIKRRKSPLLTPKLPDFNDSSFAENFGMQLRSLDQNNVPQNVNKYFLFTVGLGLTSCPKNQRCKGLNDEKMAGPINNVSFVHPKIALLEAYFSNQSKGIYTTDFPKNPPFEFDYTGKPPINTMVNRGTKVVVLPFNARVEIVLQGTSIISPESHPFHLHGFNFFVVGRGSGNFDANRDPTNFNLVDPVERNTVSMPAGGWVAIRFIADNPGVWLMHCHLEIHTSWGMEMAWIVLDGEHSDQKLPPPPSDLPKC